MSNVNFEALDIRIKSLDEKIRLLLDEAEKRNGQRFDAQQEAVATAMVAQEKAVLAAMAAAEKAVSKAEIASEKRFESVNEFRQTLSDQTASFLTRSEYVAQHQSLIDKIDTFDTRITTQEKLVGEIRERGSGRSDVWTILVSVIGIIISLSVLTLLIMTKVGN